MWCGYPADGLFIRTQQTNDKEEHTDAEGKQCLLNGVGNGQTGQLTQGAATQMVMHAEARMIGHKGVPEEENGRQ